MARKRGAGRSASRREESGPTAGADLIRAFASSAPGLEPIVAAELVALGLEAQVVEGGAEFPGTLADVQRANLHLRAAGRVLVRLGSFRATAFHELERFAGRLPWTDYLVPGASVAVRATCRKSRLYHSSAVAERVLEAADRAVGGIVPARVPADDEAAPPESQLIVVRVAHDRVTVSADSSGALLHLRGYRQEVAKAPLRETLAAAMLLGAPWNPGTPLLDPMCGSGTIPIEAALMARRIPPGLGRRFAFERWPGFARASWEAMVAGARGEILPSAPAPIIGSDRDAGAIRAALGNAERAGVAGDVEIVQRPVSAAEPIVQRATLAAESIVPRPGSAMEPPGTGPAPGAIVTNPPYGVRVGERTALRDLYARLGQVARERFAGWTFALLSADRQLEAQLRLDLEERFRTKNGGIPVRFVATRLPG